MLRRGLLGVCAQAVGRFWRGHTSVGRPWGAKRLTGLTLTPRQRGGGGVYPPFPFAPTPSRPPTRSPPPTIPICSPRPPSPSVVCQCGRRPVHALQPHVPRRKAQSSQGSGHSGTLGRFVHPPPPPHRHSFGCGGLSLWPRPPAPQPCVARARLRFVGQHLRRPRRGCTPALWPCRRIGGASCRLRRGCGTC